MTATIPSLINELKIIGYTLYLEGENLKYRYIASTEPPKDKVIPLLDTLKRNKGEVKEYLTFKDKHIPNRLLADLLNRCFNELENEGIDPTALSCPDVKITEGRLDKVWGDCLKGLDTLENFKRVLQDYAMTIRLSHKAGLNI